MKATLHVVGPSEAEPESYATTMLRELVPSVQQSERITAKLRAMIAEQGRTLAKERGIGFLRIEQIMREFGK